MDNWRIHQFIGLCIISLFISILINKKYGILAGLLTLYALVSSAIMFGTISYWENLQPRIDVSAAASFAKIIALAFIAYTYEEWKSEWFWLVETATIINSFLVIFVGYGLFNAYSADAAMIAMAMPMILFKPGQPHKNKKIDTIFNLIGALVPLIAIVKAGGSTSFFILIGGFMALLIQTKQKRYVVGAALTLIIAFVVNKEMLLNSSKRVPVWQQLMQWWWDNSNHWIGTGFGSYEWLGPFTQIFSGEKLELFVFMHNDYLQLLYQGGYIGFILGLSLWIVIALKSYQKDVWLFATVATMSVCMLTQFPMEFFLSQIFMVCIACEALCTKHQKS